MIHKPGPECRGRSAQHQRVDRPEFTLDFPKHCRDSIWLVHICLHRDGLPANASNFIDYRFCLLTITPVINCDQRPAFGQLACDSGADTCASTGYQCDFVMQASCCLAFSSHEFLQVSI